MESVTKKEQFCPDIWLSKAKELYNLQQQRKNIEKLEKELSDQLKIMQHDECLSYGGIRYYYEERSGSVDYSAIPELKKIDLSLYRKPPVKVWKISIESI